MTPAHGSAHGALHHAARIYSAIGAALGFGAPIGFTALRLLLPGKRTAGPVSNDARSTDRDALAYMGLTTPVVFALFGWALGNREERVDSAARLIAQLREEFIAVVAHDLRNPVQAILLELELLTQVKEGDEVRVPRSELERLQRNADRLRYMIDDLLDATRLEASRLLLAPEPLSVPEALASLLDRIRTTLGAHPITVEAERTPLGIRADPHRFEQIITNLLQNAAKYSAESSPISIRVRPSGAGVTIAVQDRGFGIAEEDLPRLFDRFYQSKRARKMKSGLGLGLYITKGLIEAHCGWIDVESELGRGSTFTVWLPSAGPTSDSVDPPR